MQTKIIKLYSFDELSKEAQNKAVNDLFDINTDYKWWDFIYEDAERMGLKIKSFDFFRKKITGEFITDAKTLAENIVNEYVEESPLYITCKNYLDTPEPEGAEYVGHRLTFKEQILKIYLRD